MIRRSSSIDLTAGQNYVSEVTTDSHFGHSDNSQYNENQALSKEHKS